MKVQSSRNAKDSSYLDWGTIFAWLGARTKGRKTEGSLMKWIKHTAFATTIFVGLALGNTARADFSLVTGISGGNTGTDNVLFNPCVGASQVAGSTFQQGCLNTSHTTLID